MPAPADPELSHPSATLCGVDGEEATVRAMREAGAIWRVIAAELGVDRNELYERYVGADWNKPLRAAYMEEFRRRQRVKAEQAEAKARRRAEAERRRALRIPTRGNGPIPTLLRSPEDQAAFWAKVNKDGPAQSAPELGPCWLWLGNVDGKGYGSFGYRGKTFRAHRLAYRLMRGPTHYATLDHLCHTLAKYCQGGPRCWHRRCVNPAHLEDVPLQENGYRHSHRFGTATCRQGHVWSSENTLFDIRGLRVCRDCLIADAIE